MFLCYYVNTAWIIGEMYEKLIPTQTMYLAENQRFTIYQIVTNYTFPLNMGPLDTSITCVASLGAPYNQRVTSQIIPVLYQGKLCVKLHLQCYKYVSNPQVYMYSSLSHPSRLWLVIFVQQSPHLAMIHFTINCAFVLSIRYNVDAASRICITGYLQYNRYNRQPS